MRVVPWVRSEARSELEALVRADAVQEPRRWNDRIAYYSRRRYVRLAVRSLDLLGRVRGVEVCNPLLDPGFLAALARNGAAAGFSDRTRIMRELFGDVLPAELIARRGKAEFGRALWREEARSFAACWDGRGVDTALVDPEQLRNAWDVPSPLFGANTLLQQAWLAAHEK
jgi:Asparagine synthase